MKNILLGLSVLILMGLIGCRKETITPIERSRILEYIDADPPYQYGYIAKGAPTYFSDSLGNTYGLAYKFKLYTNSIWYVGDDITGKLCQCDSLVTLNETVIIN
tara:strand:+ start:31 stop:342 length:312 start_codon:yes stop_codon:yes gene_type:complete